MQALRAGKRISLVGQFAISDGIKEPVHHGIIIGDGINGVQVFEEGLVSVIKTD